MDKKHILIIVVIIAIVAIIGGYFLFNTGVQTTTEHTTIVLSKSAYMEVPKDSNATSKADKKGIFYYNDKNDDINITSSSSLSTSDSAKEMKKLKNTVATGSKKLKENDVFIYEKDGVYSVFVKNTQYNDTLLIQSSDKDLLLQCWESVNYHDPTDKIKFDNDTSSGSVVSAVEKTESAVQASAPAASSSSSNSGSSSADWGYDWSSSSSSKSSSSQGSISGGSSSSDIFDFS